jgi:hypothetical protein
LTNGDGRDADERMMSHQSQPASDTAMSNSRVPGELNGELYTQVQRTSNGFLESRTSSSLDEESFSSTVVATNSSGRSSATLSRITTSSHNGSVITKTFKHSFSTGFLGVNANDSSLFNEILSKLSENCRNDSEEDTTDRTPTDTAYNSAAGSENSSLERKNKFETDSLSHSSTVKDFSSSCDEINNHTPLLSNIEYQISIGNRHSNEEEQTKNFQNTLHGLDKGLTVSNVIISNVSNTQMTDSYSKSNRDQCDSAIFESDSFMDDLSCASPDALKRKIEQLRTHLVELKQRRYKFCLFSIVQTVNSLLLYKIPLI